MTNTEGNIGYCLLIVFFFGGVVFAFAVIGLYRIIEVLATGV